MIRGLMWLEIVLLLAQLSGLPSARVIVSDALVRDRREHAPVLPDDLSQPNHGQAPSTVHHPPSTQKPTVCLYVTEGCTPCRRLKAEYEQRRSELPFEIVPKPAPAWADNPAPDGTFGYPVLHWQAADSSWKQFRGWPANFGFDRFRTIWERTQERP